MRLYKAILVFLLMLCSFGAYAQNRKCYTVVLAQDVDGKKYFIVGNNINNANDLVYHLLPEGSVALWKGKAEAKAGKILWVTEQSIPILRNYPNKPSRYVVEPGKGIKALKSFLNSKEGLAVKNKYFTSSTEYIASSEVNTHMTENFTTLANLSNGELSERLSSLYFYVENAYRRFKSGGAENADELALMKKTAREIIDIYELVILIDPSFATTAYENAKPYIEKIAESEGNPVNDFEKYRDFRGILRGLTSDLMRTFRKTLGDASIVLGAANESPFNKPTIEIMNAAKTVLSSNAGPGPWFNQIEEESITKGKYEAIRSFVNLLKTQEITSATFNKAELMVLRLTLSECRNIIGTGVSLMEFDPDYNPKTNALEVIKIDLETMLADVVKAQETQWIDGGKKGENPATAKGMLEYSEEVYKEASSNSLDLFSLVFKDLENFKSCILRMDKY